MQNNFFTILDKSWPFSHKIPLLCAHKRQEKKKGGGEIFKLKKKKQNQETLLYNRPQNFT